MPGLPIALGRAILAHMRVRMTELLGPKDKRRMTPYALAKRSGGRITLSTAYRLVRSDGRLSTFGAEVLEALCDIFDVEPGELLERDGMRRKRGRS